MTVPIKRWDCTMDKISKSHLYADYKRFILALKTPADWKLGDGETSSIEMGVKRMLD